MSQIKKEHLMNKNNLYLKILILLTFMTQTASASMDYFLTYYIPIDSEMDINSKNNDGIALHKAIAYTYYSEPESAIGFITNKYIINTPHKAKELEHMRNHNINLAYIKGLNVELLDYGSKECRVVMDSSKVVTEDSPEALAKILKYVKKATKLNMKEHKIDCAFEEITAPRLKKGLAFPKVLNMEQSAFLALDKYSSNIEGVPFLYNNFYPLGYSSDGKFAYIKEYDTDPADMVLIRTFIQDLVTDKIVWKDEYRVEENITNMGVKSFWKERGGIIENKLKKYAINTTKNMKFEKNYHSYKDNIYFVESHDKRRFYKDWGMSFLESSVISLGAKSLGMKTIDSRVYKGEHLIARQAIGFIPLGESDRVAVVVANVRRGWEGPPHNLSYDIVGASLRVGFKP